MAGLCAADRHHQLDTEILPALREAAVVVCDRYLASTMPLTATGRRCSALRKEPSCVNYVRHSASTCGNDILQVNVRMLGGVECGPEQFDVHFCSSVDPTLLPAEGVRDLVIVFPGVEFLAVRL
ncbi:hypothetical protein [Actinokineospora cianjurensis]|uniref:hypothetical protein n=1 Tax=Actinokineospora cianjurensis TaxID=585224 RepID=UPI000EADE8BB|nr:hypothetical protein [Actinokineospora cianjurensis]